MSSTTSWNKRLVEAEPGTEFHICTRTNYQIHPEPVGQGLYGTVHRARNKFTKETFALKFFGYVKSAKRIPEPNMVEINREIYLMSKLKDVSGVVQLISVFQDTKKGMLENKNTNCLEPYPVIVMENVAGESIVKRIVDRAMNGESISEKYLATLFKSVIRALLGIHQKGFVHCDLKGSNVLLASTDPAETSVKIIDFGHMEELHPYEREFKRKDHRKGTSPFLAPESLGDDEGIHEYSAKSDVWQLGCLFYCLLCLHVPFSEEKHIRTGNYVYHTQQYAALSLDAKKLLFAMFRPNPKERISLQGLLHHPWFTSASDENLYNGYAMRVRSLSLLPKIKQVIERLKEERHTVTEDRGSMPLRDGGDDLSHTATTTETFCIPFDSNYSCLHFFNAFGSNEEGRIPRETFVSILMDMIFEYNEQLEGLGGCLGTASSDHITASCIEDLHRVIDIDGDGFVEYSEFETFFKNVPFDLMSLTIPLSFFKTSSHVLAEQKGSGIQGDGFDHVREKHAKNKRKLAAMAVRSLLRSDL